MLLPLPKLNNAITLAAEAGKKGDYQQAVKILREAVSETDAPPEAWLLLGRSLHVLKDYPGALAAFYDYLRQKPRSADGYFFTGRTYLAVGMPYKAVPFLRKALEKFPKRASSPEAAEYKSRAKALLGAAYIKSRHSQAAVEILQEAVESAPNDKRIYRAYLNSLFIRGIRLCGIDDYEMGLQMLRFVLENREEAGMEESPLLHLHLGRAARETGNLWEALEHYTAALKLSKDKNQKEGDRRIRWSRASILMALGKTAEAVKEIEKIRFQDKTVPELPWNSELVDLFMIKSFMDSGEWRQAADSCKNWLKLRGRAEDMANSALQGQALPLIHALYAEALRNLGYFETAHNHLMRALEEDPKALDFWYADILVSWEGKDYKSVKKAIRAAKSLGGDETVLSRFSILCQTLGSEDLSGNITLLQNAVRRQGPEPELMYTLGEAYLKAGLIEESISWMKKTISLKKSHERAWLGLMAGLEALINYESTDRFTVTQKEIASTYDKYLKIWPSNSSIRRDRALLLVKTFNYAEAIPELEKLLVLEPSNRSLRRVLAYCYRKTGRYREAAVYLKALLREKPKDEELLIEYTGCLYRTGAKEYALQLLEKARELFQKSGDISLALGILNFRQKNVEKAFDLLREAASLSPKDPRPYEWMAEAARRNGDSDYSHYENEAQKRKTFKKPQYRK